jgi:nitroreductase
MKIKLLIILGLVLSLGILVGCNTGAPAAQTQAPGISNMLPYLAANAQVWRSGLKWDDDPAKAPTDEELTAMLRMACTAGTFGGLQNFHFVVVRDMEAIQSILGEANSRRSVGAAQVMILVFADQARKQEYHAAPYDGQYIQNFYGIFDAGTAMGFLEIAAMSLGYNVHPIAMMDLGIIEERGFVGARSFDEIQKNYYRASRFLTSKDGTTRFTHTLNLRGTPGDVEAEGNLTLLCSLIIGKLTTVEAESAATANRRDDNFDFWDPQK